MPTDLPGPVPKIRTNVLLTPERREFSTASPAPSSMRTASLRTASQSQPYHGGLNLETGAAAGWA